MDLRVKVEYKNREMQPVFVQDCTLCEYTDMLRVDLMRLISDVENVLYIANSGVDKRDWPDEQMRAFLRIKHKLLDKAGEIGRLPENIYEDEDEPLGITESDIMRPLIEMPE